MARLRPTSNAPGLVCVSCPAAMSRSMFDRPLSRFSPWVSSVRLSTCGLVRAKLDGLIASTKRAWRSAACRGSPSRYRRSRRRSPGAGRKSANSSCGWCRRSGSRAIRARRSGGPWPAWHRPRRTGTAPAITLPQASRPLVQASAPALISAIGSAPAPSPPAKPNALGDQAGNGSSVFRLSAQNSISICWARPITSVQCCQSSRVGIDRPPVFLSSAITPLLRVAARETKLRRRGRAARSTPSPPGPRGNVACATRVEPRPGRRAEKLVRRDRAVPIQVQCVEGRPPVRAIVGVPEPATIPAIGDSPWPMWPL